MMTLTFTTPKHSTFAVAQEVRTLFPGVPITVSASSSIEGAEDVVVTIQTEAEAKWLTKGVRDTVLQVTMRAR
jgi:hypothetical protein